MLPLSALSRRALVGAAAFTAVAPRAGAKKKKKKKKPPPPLAFVAAVISTAPPLEGVATFQWEVEASLVHPASAIKILFVSTVPVAVEATTEQVRAAVAAALQSTATTTLDGFGQSVPADRIGVALL